MTKESIFHNALALPAAQRAAFLDAASGGRPELRAAVVRLLAAHEASGNMLDVPIASVDSATGVGKAEPENEAPLITLSVFRTGNGADAVIAGRYSLLEKIGEGGMGEVWVAKQTEPVKRRVALKLIKTGVDSKTVLARFEQERQALALMDHPNIARVLDGGMTPSAQPFFVMELVNGLPLIKFCDEAKLNPTERLELFVPICHAVQHAHQKGIVHRDLKPANILVTMVDGKAVPKVIDFGVAKATSGKLTTDTLATEFGSMIGTLEYMSPEQAGFSGQDIDTRSDIYSLGVILYELLTGLRPHDARSLKKVALLEMIRILREEEPARPSTRLSTDKSLRSLAAVRQMEPRRLMAILRGELDWVVMKCLEKSRDRRYESANGLARDIQRYLSNEPVEARPPTAGYRFGKFLQRNKGAVLAAGIVLFVMLAGIVGTTLGLFEARHQEQLARGETAEKEKARQSEAEQRTLAEAQKEKAVEAARAEKLANAQAQKRLTQIEKANDILGSIFENLDPKEIAKAERPLHTILAEKLDKAAEQLDGESIGEPLVVAHMQTKFGLSLLGLGEYKRAIVLLQKARATYLAKGGPESSDALTAANNLGIAYLDARNPELALPLLEEALKSRSAKFGPEHSDTLSSMSSVATAYQAVGKVERAVPLFEQALKVQSAKYGPDHPDTLNFMQNLAVAYQEAGQLELAKPLFEKAVMLMTAKLGPTAPITLLTKSSLAEVYQKAGKHDLALTLMEETLKLTKATLGANHPDTLATMHKLAFLYRLAEKIELALPLIEETFEIMKAKLGPDNPDTLTAMNELAVTYHAAGKPELALSLFKESLELSSARQGPEHPATLQSLHNLAQHYLKAEQLDLALPLCEKAVKLRQAVLGYEHSDTQLSIQGLANACQHAGKHDQAVALLKEALQFHKAEFGPEHSDTLESMVLLADAYQKAWKPDLAVPLFEEALKLCVSKFGPEHTKTLDIMNELAVAYWRKKQLDKSIPLLQETLKLKVAKLGRNHPTTLVTISNLGVNYVTAGRSAEGAPLLEEAYRGATSYSDKFINGSALLDCCLKLGKTERAIELSKALILETRNALPKDSPQLAAKLAVFSLTLLEVKAFAEAEAPLRECLAIREKLEADAWTTSSTKSMLGGALLGQKNYADAEPLLVKGYSGMKEREKTIPPQGRIRLTQALDRLVALYTALKKPGEVQRWQAERAKYPNSAIQRVGE